MTHLPSYPSIYALGHRAITEILSSGPVVIEEKIDGSQISMCKTNGELCMRSKGKDLVIEAPEKMFNSAVATAKSLDLHDGWIYRGEYLQSPSHNTLAYARIPNKHIIIFDVMTGPECYLSPADKAAECSRIGLECVPLYHEGIMTNTGDIMEMLKRTSILGSDVPIEGVVIKNYNLFCPDKKISIAKVVAEDFKEKHHKSWKSKNPTCQDIVQILIAELRTEARWNKAVQHLRDAGALLGEPRDIGPIIKEVQSDTMKEESDYIKEKLYQHLRQQIERSIVHGIPEWYKKKLSGL